MENHDPAETTSAEAARPPAPRGPFRVVRNLAFASVGLVDALVDGPHALYQRTIERGENRIQRIRERVPRGRRLRGIPGRVTGGGRRASRTMEQIDAALARLNVPTPADFDALTAQVTALEVKIDQLGAS